MDVPPLGFKVSVTQTYDVYLFYGEGLVLSEGGDDELEAIVKADAIELAFNESGLVSRLHENTETSNGLIGLVHDFDPDVEIEYSIEKMPTPMAKALVMKLNLPPIEEEKEEPNE